MSVVFGAAAVVGEAQPAGAERQERMFEVAAPAGRELLVVCFCTLFGSLTSASLFGVTSLQAVFVIVTG